MSHGIHGIMAEFATPEEAARAARSVRDQGFIRLDAYGPFPSEELTEAIGFQEKNVAPCVLGGGIFGGLLGYAFQYYATVIDYPHNIGGRPLNSWPSFIPVTFETTVLGAVVTGIASFLILNRLPRLAHPAFCNSEFRRASTDRFFLCVRADNPEFSVERAHELLGSFQPLSVTTVGQEAEP